MEKCEKAKLSTFFKIFYLSFQNRIRHKHQNLNENIEKEKKKMLLILKIKTGPETVRKIKLWLLVFCVFFKFI